MVRVNQLFISSRQVIHEDLFLFSINHMISTRLFFSLNTFEALSFSLTSPAAPAAGANRLLPFHFIYHVTSCQANVFMLWFVIRAEIKHRLIRLSVTVTADQTTHTAFFFFITRIILNQTVSWRLHLNLTVNTTNLTFLNLTLT